ncbi:MAG: AAA family ATPase [Burkholderiales bacterium]|nr:AAA family ATPase [Burkholderiales bacterium]
MYYSHFGLDQAPFKITPNTEFFFGGGNRGPILEALIYAISHGEGIIKVTGEVGSGKTMLCNMLQTQLQAHIETVYLANPSVSPDDILHAIAFESQLGVDRNASRLEVMQALHDHLLKRHADGKRVVVFVEESQSMPLATLEEIRLLSNLETRNDKLLQIVLFGQPELDDNLRLPNIRQLRERITHSFRLEPLGVREIHEYLMFRMRAAGYRGPDLFSPAVVKFIAQASDGLTRRVNLIADKALLAAFSENTHTIRMKHVEAAVRDSEFSQNREPRITPRLAWGTTLVLLGAALGVGAYVLFERGGDVPVKAPAVAANTPAPTDTTTAASPPPGTATDTQNTLRNKNDISNKTTGYGINSAAPAAGPVANRLIAAKTAATPEIASAQSISASAAGGPPQASPADLVQLRLAATREWLASEKQNTVSIQLMGTNDEQQLKNYLNVLSNYIEINGVFVYRTKAKQKPSITVLYGSFSNVRAAKEALAGLPPFLKKDRPLLRTVHGVRAEIKQNETSSLPDLASHRSVSR